MYYILYLRYDYHKQWYTPEKRRRVKLLLFLRIFFRNEFEDFFLLNDVSTKNYYKTSTMHIASIKRKIHFLSFKKRFLNHNRKIYQKV